MKRVKGEQMYVFMGSAEALLPVGASTDCTLSLSAEAVEVASRGQGAWRRFRAGKKQWSVDVSGFYFDAVGLPTSIKEAEMIGGRYKVAVTVLAQELVDAGVTTSVTPNAEHCLVGDAILTSCQFAGSNGSLATYNITLQGSGELAPIK